ncbi:MAG: hypothetical protein WC023_06535 [Rhodocyclaceae bacterium]
MNWLRNLLGLCLGYFAVLVIFAPMLAAIADVMLWLFGASYRVVEWNDERGTFAFLWTILMAAPGIGLLIALEE